MNFLEVFKSKTIRIYAIILWLFLFCTIMILSNYSNFFITFSIISIALGGVMIIDRYFSMKYLEFQKQLKENEEKAISYFKDSLSKPTSKSEENILIQKQIEKKGIRSAFFGSNMIIGFITLETIFLILSLSFSFKGINYSLIIFWVFVAFYAGFICRQSTAVIKKIEDFKDFENKQK